MEMLNILYLYSDVVLIVLILTVLVYCVYLTREFKKMAKTIDIIYKDNENQLQMMNTHITRVKSRLSHVERTIFKKEDLPKT